jgi:V8-like Glu-specific endopeptidase
VLTSAREQQYAPGSDTEPGQNLSEFKKELEVAGATAIALPRRAIQRRKKVNVKEALRDMRLPSDVKELLAGPLRQLSYAIDEAEVRSRYRAADVRWISVIRRDGDVRQLLHIPGTVLKNENNFEAFDHLRYFFSKGATVYIISPKLGTFPHHSYARLVTAEWPLSDNVKVYFINWDWLKESTGPDPDLNAFATLFEPPLDSSDDDLVVEVPPRIQVPNNEGGGPNVMARSDLPAQAVERIAQAIGDLASTNFSGPTAYYRDLISRAGLPPIWAMEISGVWTGNAIADARALVRWAIARGVNPADTRYTTLGSILSAALDGQGAEDQNKTVALILAYDLYRDRDLLARLAARYQAPIQPSEPSTADPVQPGPAFELREQLGDLELQSLLPHEPELLDVGSLTEAIKKSASICRVETSDGEALGTGFLVARRLLLTNCHVLECAPGQGLEEKARNLVLRFRSVTAATGRESEGQPYWPDRARPLLQSSPVPELDYALIQVEDRIAKGDLMALDCSDFRPLAKKMALNILGHPKGGPMKLALSGNGVVGVYPEAGLVQYATRALRGSSGSPCFDADWHPVAIHHAERAKSFGAVREGILLEPIFDQISSFL